MSNNTIGTVYFAGPLFTQAEQEWNLALASGLRAAGYRVLLPQELAVELFRPNEPLPTKELFDGAIRSIRECDVVLAALDGPDPDSGTCFECGYAHAIGRPVVGVRTDLRSGGDDDSAGVNLMLSESSVDLIRLTPSELGTGHSELLHRVIMALSNTKAASHA